MQWTDAGNPGETLIAKPGEPIVNITSFTARQKVSGYVGSQISHMLAADEPALVLSEQRLVWRVPILLTSPVRGVLGAVGTLDVDARTGQLLLPPDFKSRVAANAETLFASVPLN